MAASKATGGNYTTGGSWQRPNSVVGTGVAIDYRNDQYLYEASYLDIFHSQNRGADWEAARLENIHWDERVVRAHPTEERTVFASVLNTIYQSNDAGDSWSRIDPTPFPYNITNFTISRSGLMYVCMEEGGSESLYVYANGTMENRSPHLNFYQDRVVKVAIHPFDVSIAFACTFKGEIFKTENEGQDWVNITGDLPNTICYDAIADPYDRNHIVVATIRGCYITNNGGESWQRWETGMPTNLSVTELDYELTADNALIVYAATGGRGIYKRRFASLFKKRQGMASGNEELSKTVSLQNFPNPFSGQTTIEYQLPQKDEIRLQVLDLQGRMVKVLDKGHKDGGKHKVVFHSGGLASGICIYTLQTSNGVMRKKMVVK